MSILPAILIVAAGFVLLTGRDDRLVLAAFFAQWVGISWLVWTSTSPGADTLAALIELVTALCTSAIMYLTLVRTTQPPVMMTSATTGTLRTIRPRRRLAIPRGSTGQPQDWLLMLGMGILAAVGGYGLARVNLLGINENELLAFFWLVLPVVLMLTLDAARSAVKLGLGILSLCNAAFLLLYIVDNEPPGTGLLAMAALARIGAAMLISYIWLIVRARYSTLNLNTLFDRRDGIIPTSNITSLTFHDDEYHAAAGTDIVIRRPAARLEQDEDDRDE